MAKAAKQAEVTHPYSGEILAPEFLGPKGISAKAIMPHGT